MTDAAIERMRNGIREGRYMLSEHVIRSLMGGEVCVPEIEAVIRSGRILEEHRHQTRTPSCLFCGIVKGKPVHAVAAEGANGWIVVSFAYVPRPPLWRDPRRRAGRDNGGKMSRAFNSCFFCAGEIKAVTVGSFDYRLDGKLYVIKRVPAGLCLQCGEKYVDTEVGRRLNTLIQDQLFTATEEVQVIEYQ